MGTRIHRAFIAALLGLGLGASTAAEAGALADLSIVNRSTGQTLPVYQHQGRYYVAGTPGDKYAVAVRNKTEQRLMAVISVDGVNVVSGETAAPTQTGYVLGAGFNYADYDYLTHTSGYTFAIGSAVVMPLRTRFANA